jgi:hypothetical protein
VVGGWVGGGGITHQRNFMAQSRSIHSWTAPISASPSHPHAPVRTPARTPARAYSTPARAHGTHLVGVREGPHQVRCVLVFIRSDERYGGALTPSPARAANTAHNMQRGRPERTDIR